MEIRKIQIIYELAQEFMDAPRLISEEGNVILLIDYEKEKGGYSKKGIKFIDVKKYWHTPRKLVTIDMIKAYNIIAEVVDTEIISKVEKEEGYKHYLIYFDEIGAYEFIAKEYEY